MVPSKKNTVCIWWCLYVMLFCTITCSRSAPSFHERVTHTHTIVSARTYAYIQADAMNVAKLDEAKATMQSIALFTEGGWIRVNGVWERRSKALYKSICAQ
ncbi:hypothetical protein BX666DRAFT_1963205 [Dichotomocladium elegans]|nr:hypothetical protein BX666DRAFT_1963205 [Dichotomocladium elegans]